MQSPANRPGRPPKVLNPSHRRATQPPLRLWRMGRRVTAARAARAQPSPVLNGVLRSLLLLSPVLSAPPPLLPSSFIAPRLPLTNSLQLMLDCCSTRDPQPHAAERLEIAGQNSYPKPCSEPPASSSRTPLEIRPPQSAAAPARGAVLAVPAGMTESATTKRTLEGAERLTVALRPVGARVTEPATEVIPGLSSAAATPALDPGDMPRVVPLPATQAKIGAMGKPRLSRCQRRAIGAQKRVESMVHVSRLRRCTSVADLEHLFGQCGKIRQISMDIEIGTAQIYFTEA